MALNLIRNSRAFFTTNVSATGVIAEGTAATTANTYELQVLDGFSFSQNTNSEQVTVSEAGVDPTRGQRSFNTSLAPVDFSFSTYIRPRFSTNVLCEESVLWNALMGTTAQNTVLAKSGTFSTVGYNAATNTLTITGTSMAFTGLAVGSKVLINGIVKAGSGTDAEAKAVNGPATCATVSATSITFNLDVPYSSTIATANLSVTNVVLYSSAWGQGTTQSIASFHGSDKNQLQTFGMIIIVDSVTYLIDNCALNEATIDFGLDGIATVQWTGQATALRQLSTNATASAGTFGGGLTGSYTQKSTTAGFITNKLSTATLSTKLALGAIAANTPYYIALTGGNITISNNITYITPEILGVVNQPVTYYTGTRSISGTLNAYLNTGSVTGYTGGGTGNLLKDMLAAASTVTEPMFTAEVAIGGSSNAVRVELQMPSISIGVPAVNTEQVVSTAISFTASGSSGVGATLGYDLEATNDLVVRYFAA